MGRKYWRRPLLGRAVCDVDIRISGAMRERATGKRAGRDVAQARNSGR